MADVGLSSSAKSTGTVLVLKFMNSTTGLCNPGYDAIAAATGRTRRPAIASAAELRSRGWLTWDGTAGGSQSNTNQFRFVMRADALDIEAGAKRRLADEYDAAQDRGEVSERGGERSGREHSPAKPTAADIGISRKDIHEARIIRDAEKADPAAETDPVISTAPVPSTAPVLNTGATGAVNGKRPVLQTAHELSIELSRNHERGARRTRADFLPDDFKVSDETYAWALGRLGSNDAVDHSLDRFRNHFRSVDGPKAKSRDWQARARNWIDDDAKAPQDKSVHSAAVRLAEKVASFDRGAGGSDATDEQWNGVLGAFVRFGRWTKHVDQFGPPPNEAGCRAPQHLLVKHGITMEAAE